MQYTRVAASSQQSNRFGNIKNSFATALFLVIFLACGQLLYAQLSAGDDFYIVDRTQFINTYENDVFGGVAWTLVTAPAHGGVGPACTIPGACNCNYCPIFSPVGNYIGFDSFQYKYVSCCGNPPGDSNVATVTVAIIGNDDAQNAGDSCPAVGKPINVTNGNMWLQQSDYRLPGPGDIVEVNRFYNSIIQSSGLFGFGWSTKYDESIVPYGDKMIRLNQPNGRAAYFGRLQTTIPYTSFSPDVTGQIVTNADGTYTLTYKDGRSRKFSSTGKLLWQKDKNGSQTTLNYDINGFLTSITDAVGRTLTFTRSIDQMVISDSIGTVATYDYVPATTLLQTVTYSDGSKYKFEYVNKTVSGQVKTYLATVKDALDNILETHDYDSSGRAITSEKQGGVEKYTVAYTFDFLNNPVTIVTDALTPGRVTKYHYAQQYGSNIVTKTEGICSCGGSGSEVTQYFYDTKDSKLNLKQKIDALGRTTDYTFDVDGNLLQKKDSFGTTILGIEKYTYNSRGEVLTYKDRVASQNPDQNVNTVVNTYSSTGNLLTSKDALSNTTTFTYTSLGQLETIKDALNHTTTLTYDTQGRLTQVKDANNKTTNIGYDARVRPTSVTNALSETTTFEYDLNNRLKKAIYPDTNFITYTYDLAGRRTGITDARNNTTAYAYDGAYRLTSITDALTHSTSFDYDLMSNLTSQTDALGNVTNYDYDDFNRLKKITYPASTSGAIRLTEGLTYDTLGNVKTRVDTDFKTTTYDYDTLNRLIKITNPLLKTTQFEYNGRSQMTKVIDALNQQYTFTYDALGRELSQTRAGSTMSFEYDAVGNRKKRTDYIGRVTNYEYDNLNRLKKIVYGNPVTNGGPPNLQSTYTYDDLSRLISAVNDMGAVSFTYDNRNRVQTTTDVFGHVLTYNYDSNGNRTELKVDGTTQTTYAYDVANRLTQLTDEASQNFSFGYDVANKLISKTLPNGIASTFNYDGMSRLTELKHQGTSTITDNQFSYNAKNEIGQIAELTQTKVFSFDDVHRLTGMNNGATAEGYSFDGVGNRTASHRSASYTYQPNNEVTATTTATYRYDADGNMTSKWEASNSWRYIWDFENRMTMAATPKQNARYKYDALGRRVQRIFGYGIENTKFIYDGLDVVMDDDANSGITKYQNGLGIDDHVKLTNGGVSKYFLQDHLGSTLVLTNSSGAATEQIAYDSFGNPTNSSFSSRYQYTGREFDSFTGLQYNRARYYDANLGRFISEDPIGFGGGDLNLYGYVKNLPIAIRDPRGLSGEEVLNNPDVLKGLAGVVTVVAPFVPPVAVAAVGAGAIYGAYQVGEWSAHQPWNPLSQPWGYPTTPPYPDQTERIRRLTSPTAGPACEPRPRTLPWERGPAIPRLEEPPNDREGCHEEIAACVWLCEVEAPSDPGRYKEILLGGYEECMSACITPRCKKGTGFK